MDRFEELMEQIRINLNDDKRFEKQLMWIRDKVEHYSSVFGFSKVEILEAFEKKKNILVCKLLSRIEFSST